MYKIDSENNWIPDGFHFLGPEESRKRRELLTKLKSYFIDSSFLEVTPSSFDFSSSFLKFLPLQEKDRLLKSRDLFGKEISPSMDLTIQVVKGMASLEQNSKINKVFYTGTIVKDNHKQNADLREFLQLGVEIMGNSGKETLFELLHHIDKVMGMSGLKNKLTLVLGNTSIFQSLAGVLSLKNEEAEYLSKLIYQKNVFDIQLFLESYKPKQITEILVKMLTQFEFDSIETDLLNIDSQYNLNIKPILESTKYILDESKESFENIDLCIDYSLIRDLGYYTGFVFHGYIDKLTYPLVMGGEYNHLFEKFAGIPKDSFGFAININLFEQVLL